MLDNVFYSVGNTDMPWKLLQLRIRNLYIRI